MVANSAYCQLIQPGWERPPGAGTLVPEPGGGVPWPGALEVPAEDVAVAEGGRAVGGWCRRGDRWAGHERLPEGVNGRAVGSVADVVPHRHRTGSAGCDVVVVAEEFFCQ